jgi:hypothetical protein
MGSGKRIQPVWSYLHLALPAAVAVAVCARPACGEKGRAAVGMSPHVREALNLVDGEVARVHVGSGPEAPSRLRTIVPIDGVEHTLDLTVHSVRSPLFTVVKQGADGSFVKLPAGPVRTMRGTVAEIPGSSVAASVGDGGLEAMIMMPDATRYWIEPIGGRVRGAAADNHAVYHDAGVAASGGTCAVVNDDSTNEPLAPAAEGGAAGNTLVYAELAVDADVEFVNDFLTPEAAQAQIESIINTINIQYERDLGLTHALTRIVLRTSEPDPYSQTNANFLLDEFKLEWDTVQRNVPRDVAHLFTGKNLDTTVVGVAWRGGSSGSGDTVCGPYGYSLVESNCVFGCSSFAAKTDLTAHELGHNWGADHCDCAGWTMHPSLQTANRFHEVDSIPEMLAFRDTRSCLDVGDELRRLMIDTETRAVPEGEPTQFMATADFRFAGGQDVTDEATWVVDPPDAGTFDASGGFTPAPVGGNACATVSAAYTFEAVTRGANVLITILDGDAPLAVTATDPPTGAIDARRPADPSTFLPLGWRTVEIALSDELCSVLPSDFVVSQEGGFGVAPNVTSVEHLGAGTYRLTLNRALEPGAWTDIAHTDSGTTLRLGFLPGDVDQSGTVDTDDIFALVDVLYRTSSLPPYATDTDHSGETLPVDLLALVELLGGTATTPGWFGAGLP